MLFDRAINCRRGRPRPYCGEKPRKLFSLACLLIVLAASATAQKPRQPNPLTPKPGVAPQPGPLPSTGPHELTAADLEAFLDGVMPLQLRREDIAGATIAVVKDGKVLFEKGYGFADSEKRVPV